MFYHFQALKKVALIDSIVCIILPIEEMTIATILAEINPDLI